ncbi:hypothetical protein L7F22_045835 [Adiantum nelumboides]|nr:hypothetical protein [Adiantum nelumboides]
MGPPTPPHVVVFPFPAQGHVNGAMDIARKLASLGISITFVCTEAYIAHTIKNNVDIAGTAGGQGGATLPIRLVGLPDGLPPGSKADSVSQVKVLVEVTEKMGPLVRDLLIKLNKEDRIACVLYDFMLWWIGSLGRKLGMPTYIFYAMSASFFSYLSYIPEFVSQGRLPLGPHTDLSDESNMFKIPGFPSLHASEVPDISWSPNVLCSFDYTLRSTAAWRDATGILFNTVYELEKEVIDALRERAPEMDIRAVGPLLPDDFLSSSGEVVAAAKGGESTHKNAESSCLRWLDNQAAGSVLYIAFGTIATPRVEQLHALAMGLEASGERFVWVVRAEIQGDEEVDDDDDGAGEPAMEAAERKGKETNDRCRRKKLVEVAGGCNISISANYTSVLPGGFEERTKGRGLVLWELAPQRKILAHPAIGGFLTHCGWNSTLEAISKGVPMLCCPMFGDQSMNSKWLEEVVHTGQHIQLQADAKKEVQRLVQLLMDPASPSRLFANRLRDIVSSSTLSGGSSHVNIEAFIQTLRQPIPSPPIKEFPT